jgi:NAD(P)-dependent dehydrogenase (short-subunit alcohol dehydrogenase family)
MPSTPELTIINPPGPLHNYIAADITAPSFWTDDNFPDAYKLVGLHLRKIDVLVNCAGVTQTELFQRMEASSIESIVNTNLTAMMVGTKYLLKNRYIYGGSREESTHSPVIINVASLLGLRGGSGAVAYAASKAGVLGFTRALATEMGPLHVRVNAIVPGYIETGMTKGAFLLFAQALYIHIHALTNIHEQASTTMSSSNAFRSGVSASPKKSPKQPCSSPRTSTPTIALSTWMAVSPLYNALIAPLTMRYEVDAMDAPYVPMDITPSSK